MKTKFERPDIDSIMKEMDKTIIEQRKERYIKHYIDIINNVLDQKRDEELSRSIDDGINVKEVIGIIDKYDKRKDRFEEGFRKAVKVEIAE